MLDLGLQFLDKSRGIIVCVCVFEVIALKFEIAKMQIANLKEKFRKQIRAKQIGEIKEKKRSQLLANSISNSSIQEESSRSTSRSSFSSQEQLMRAIAAFEEQAIRRIREGEDERAEEFSLQDATWAIEKLKSMLDDGQTSTAEYFLAVAQACLKREYFQLLNHQVQQYFSILSRRFYYFFEVALREAINNSEDQQRRVMHDLQQLWVAMEKILTKQLTKKAQQSKVFEYCQIILTRKINFMLDNELLTSEQILAHNMNRFIGILFMQSATIAVSYELMSTLVLLVKECQPIRLKMTEDVATLQSFLVSHLLMIKESVQDDIQENGQFVDSDLKENFNFVLLFLNTLSNDGTKLTLCDLVYQNIIEIGILSISMPPNKQIVRDLFIFIESYQVYSIPHFSKAISMICYEAVVLQVGHELQLVAIQLLGLMQERGRASLQKLQIHYAYCMKQHKDSFEELSDCLSSIRIWLGSDDGLNLQDELVKSL